MKPTPIAIVIARSFTERVTQPIKNLGGAWVDMFELWHRSDYKYVVMLAHTHERIQKRAPLVMMVATDEMLRDAIRTCCSQLNDVKCRWLFCVEPGGAADVIVRSEILADSIVEGHA